MCVHRYTNIYIHIKLCLCPVYTSVMCLSVLCKFVSRYFILIVLNYYSLCTLSLWFIVINTCLLSNRYSLSLSLPVTFSHQLSLLLL